MSDVIYGKGVHRIGDLFLFTLEKQNNIGVLYGNMVLPAQVSDKNL